VARNNAQALADVLTALRQVPRAPLAPVDVVYSDVHPLMTNLELRVPGCGVQLEVDPRTQCLVGAEVRDCDAAFVLVHGSLVSAPNSDVRQGPGGRRGGRC
jgi:hypothetical protein